MKPIHKSKLIKRSIASAVLAAALAVGVAAFPAIVDAQTAAPAAGPPNISGLWNRGAGGFLEEVKTVEGTLPPLTPALKAVHDKGRADTRANIPPMDHVVLCLPHGIMRILGLGTYTYFIQRDDKIVILYEQNRWARVVHMNQEHPANLTPTWWGHSVGKWEGNTLVIDTVGLNNKILMDRFGTPQTETTHLIERYTPSADGQKMDVTVHIEDPASFTQPWDVKLELNRKPDDRLIEYICAENNRND